MIKLFYLDIKEVYKLFKSSFTFWELHTAHTLIYDGDEIIGYK